MHRALHELYGEARRGGLLGLLPEEPIFTPCPETGLRATGADESLRVLVRCGLLGQREQGLEAVLVVDQTALVIWRRSLMRTSPQLAPLLQRCGERWAALASTSAKSFDNAVASSGAIVLSAIA